MKTALLSLIIASLGAPAFAVDLGGEELFSMPQAQPPQQAAQPPPPEATPLPVIQKPIKKAKAKPAPEKPKEAEGNLPMEFVQRDQKELMRVSSSTVMPTTQLKGKLKGIKTGDIIFARVLHSIIAFPDEQAPVVAEITDGPFRGSRLLGYSRLEPNSKRVFMDFKFISTQGETFEFLGNGVTSKGQTGFEGEYHSKEASYFTGDFVASFTAAYFDGLIPRTTNVFGQRQEEEGTETAFKKGMSAGAMSTAQRFRDKLKKVPEFSELKGPFDIGLLIVNPGVQR